MLQDSLSTLRGVAVGVPQTNGKPIAGQMTESQLVAMQLLPQDLCLAQLQCGNAVGTAGGNGNHLSGAGAGIFESGITDFPFFQTQTFADLAEQFTGCYTRFFNPQIEMLAATGTGVEREFLNLKILRLLLVDTVCARQICRQPVHSVSSGQRKRKPFCSLGGSICTPALRA